MKQRIIRLSALVGILIFVFIVYKIGPLRIWENIKQITWQNFLILMALRFLYWVLRTINWKVILEQYESGNTLFNMFSARMCSHAVNQLTPSAQVGGEAARIFMVNCSSKRISLASVIVDKTIEFLTIIVFTIMAVAIAITRIPMSTKLKTIFIGFGIASSLLVLFLLAKQKKGIFEWLIELLAKIKIKLKFLEKNREKIKETDEHISDFYRNHRLAFLSVFLLYSLLIMLWVTEIHLTLVFIGATHITFLDSFLITVLGHLAFLFPLIPGSLGIYEATYVALFALLGRSTAVGFTLVIIRRIIALLWAGFGLLGMLKSTPEKKF
ncbi:MAG: flippase-like domain-containing protein [Candidatus Aminicenantes bacterium]|nr:MAG: flippase-like domain-containing protein [Candidatus Aminicenantes bacterium]